MQEALAELGSDAFVAEGGAGGVDARARAACVTAGVFRGWLCGTRGWRQWYELAAAAGRVATWGSILYKQLDTRVRSRRSAAEL